jgi:hypothetical protein
VLCPKRYWIHVDGSVAERQASLSCKAWEGILTFKRTKLDGTKEKCGSNFTFTPHMGMLLIILAVLVGSIDGIDSYRSVDSGAPFHVVPSSPASRCFATKKLRTWPNFTYRFRAFPINTTTSIQLTQQI